MSQIALPLITRRADDPARIVVGNANRAAVDALGDPSAWPYGTMILAGPARSGKSLLARWAAEHHDVETIDGAEAVDETELFHRWNRAQESGTPLLLVSGAQGWEIALPDLKSRLGAALHLQIGRPDDEFAAALIEAHAEQRGLVLGEGATTYLVPRAERSFAGLEALVDTIDRVSLEKKQPATLSLWREALEEIVGAEQPRLF